MRPNSMKVSVAATLVAAFLLMPGIARADLVPTGVFCNLGTPFDPNWVECSGAWAGNNLGDADRVESVLEQMKADFQDVFGGIVDWDLSNYLGTTNHGQDEGPFEPFPDDEKQGTLTFRSALTGWYVLILKGGNAFSMYLFNFETPTTEVAFYMDGVDVDPVKALSHASLWGDEVPVPEPSSLLLLGSGLLGLGIVGYRRRRK